MAEQLPPVQNPLTAVMKAKSPEDYVALRELVEHLQSLPPEQNPVTIALGNVHFARFAFLDDDQLALITTYDGDFVSLRNQFEFLMAQWANDGTFTAGLGRTKDPVIGAHADGAGTFSIPRPEGPLVLEDLSRFVTTRGAAYCFLPSISGIRYLANL